MNDIIPTNWAVRFLKFLLQRNNNLDLIEGDTVNESGLLLDMAQNYLIEFVDCKPPSSYVIYRDIREAIRKYKEEITTDEDVYEKIVYFDEMIDKLFPKIKYISEEEYKELEGNKDLQLIQIEEIVFIYENDGKLPDLDFNLEVGDIELSFNFDEYESLSIEEDNEYVNELKKLLDDFYAILKPGKDYATFIEMVSLEEWY